jgi:exosortase C (VPDSG-CTERM-specific)
VEVPNDGLDLNIEHVRSANVRRRWRVTADAKRSGFRFGWFLLTLVVCFSGELWRLGVLALSTGLHSHVLLIPLVSAYLIWLRKSEFPASTRGTLGSAILIGLVAACALVLLWGLIQRGAMLSLADRLSLTMLSFVGFVIAGVIGIFGTQWLSALLFPICSLLFMVPLPDGLVGWLETGSQRASAMVADWFFGLSGVAYLREGMEFQLPGISLRVAQECSGIRSSLVLLITGAYAANLLLRTTWRRWFLVFFVIPLGIVRNGFRILTIGMLCVHVGPHMVDSAIHHRGGPVFFVLSLIPLLGVVWWLRRGEGRERKVGKDVGEISGVSEDFPRRRSA